MLTVGIPGPFDRCINFTVTEILTRQEIPHLREMSRILPLINRGPCTQRERESTGEEMVCKQH